MKTAQSLLPSQGTGALTHGFVIVAQLAILMLLFAQTLAFDYVYFDDAEYVLENPAVRAGLTRDGIYWAFTSFYMSNWHPLTWLSHMLDVSLFGVDPGWAHIHNVVLHGINTLLVYTLLLKLSGSWWKACLLSLIFLVHPLHVESVAWIAERKDLLSALFFLLGLLLYDSYRARTSTLRYIGVLIFFGLALLAKPMAVTFPVVLLILDFFVYRSCFQCRVDETSSGKFDFVKAIVEKLPFLSLSVASSAITVLAQNAGNSVTSLATHSPIARSVTAAIAYVTYLKQWLLPVNLVAFYPIDLSTSLRNGLIPAGILLTLIAIVAYLAKRLPLLAVGLCWYLVTLLPVIGLIQVGGQAHADRYMYLPSVGLLIACIYLLPSRNSRHFQFANVLTLLFIAYLSVLCFWQVSYWVNRHVLFSRVLEVVGSNYRAHIHLTQDYLDRGILNEARKHAELARHLGPGAATPYLMLGDIDMAENKFQSAEKLYRITLTKTHPPVVRLLTNIGIAIAEQGNVVSGIEALEDALKMDPTSEKAQMYLQYYRAKIKPAAAQ